MGYSTLAYSRKRRGEYIEGDKIAMVLFHKNNKFHSTSLVVFQLHFLLLDLNAVLFLYFLQDINIRKNNPGVALANTMSFIDDNMSDQRSSGLTPIQQKVMKILESNSSETGPSRQFILKQFSANQHRDVKYVYLFYVQTTYYFLICFSDALEFLNNEGHAFSTIDNDHFKATTDM